MSFPTPPFIVARPERALPASEGRISAQRWRIGLMAVDTLGAVAAVIVALVFRFGEGGAVAATTAAGGATVPYLALGMAVPPLWLTMLALAGVYRNRPLTDGGADLGRITSAGLWTLAAFIFGSYAARANLSREVVAVTVLALTGFTTAGHVTARLALRHRIREGGTLHRVVVVGSAHEVDGLVDHIDRLPHAGLRVAGVCVPGVAGISVPGKPGSDAGLLPVLGSLNDVIAAAQAVDADTIAIAGSSTLSGARLRRLSWDLEGTGIRLLLAPLATELAGPRLLVEPVGGLPFLHVKEAEFKGAPWLVKAVMDRALGGLLLLALSPILAALALAVRVSSPGPVLFRQIRVGLHGRNFSVLKFRTMYDGAHREQSTFHHLNEHDGVLFKIRKDPRVTPVGRFLRRFSLDELPQIWNVVSGSMSLVGPRPPLPSEVEQYPSDLRRRRLLVKPGISGLWQVSGRSDLSWDETVRLDLQYVESWSVGLDVMVMWKTLRAVVSGRGAY